MSDLPIKGLVQEPTGGSLSILTSELTTFRHRNLTTKLPPCMLITLIAFAQNAMIILIRSINVSIISLSLSIIYYQFIHCCFPHPWLKELMCSVPGITLTFSTERMKCNPPQWTLSLSHFFSPPSSLPNYGWSSLYWFVVVLGFYNLSGNLDMWTTVISFCLSFALKKNNNSRVIHGSWISRTFSQIDQSKLLRLIDVAVWLRAALTWCRQWWRGLQKAGSWDMALILLCHSDDCFIFTASLPDHLSSLAFIPHKSLSLIWMLFICSWF